MTLESAAHLATYREAHRRLAQSPNFLNAIREATELTRERDRLPERKRSATGGLLRAIVGGVVGFTAADMAARHFNLSPDFAKRLRTGAALTGAAMGLTKTARTEVAARDALRIGFLHAFHEHGLLKDAAFGLMVDPASMVSLPRSAAEGMAKVVGAAGTAAGVASAPSEADEELLKIRLQRDLLKEKLKHALVDKQNRRIRQALANK